MSAPKKAAKKAAAKHADHLIRDERRAHEHLVRVENMQAHAKKSSAHEISELVRLAHGEIEAGHLNHAADLARAAEHLSFGMAKASNGKETHPKLAEEFEREFQQQMKKADEHWSDEEEHLPGLAEIYQELKQRAQTEMDAGSLPAALELARAVEALSHVAEASQSVQKDNDGQE